MLRQFNSQNFNLLYQIKINFLFKMSTDDLLTAQNDFITRGNQINEK
jgi:hypothetical protein